MDNPLGLTLPPESDRIIRERMYSVAQLREDGVDVRGQMSVILNQLIMEKYTGELTIKLSEGGIQYVKVSQSQKLTI